MDATRFDQIAKTLSAAGTRRGVLGFLSTLPILGGLATLFGGEETAAKGRRKRRKKAHKHGKGRDKGKNKKKNTKQKCKPKSIATTCDGKCGPVKNNCKKTVDCGACTCDQDCPFCQICDEETRECVTDPGQQGDPCGDGQICLNTGACACSGSSCGACRTCAGDGACAGCSGCCDGDQCVATCPSCQVCDSGTCLACPDCCDSQGVCQPGDTNAACGGSGTCEECTGQEQCQDQACACIPNCAGKVCGADGCGEQCGPGCAACESCQGNGACTAPCDGLGCCDGDTCEPGTTNAACGTGGNACAECTGVNTCQSGVCGCTPITTCPAPLDCGDIDDGCGGSLDCGDCSNPTPVCVSNVCTACSVANPCPSRQICAAGSCEACDVCTSGCAFSSVQEAIAAASGGDTLVICPGTYGKITIAKILTLIGAGEGTNAASNTILDAAGTGPAVDIDFFDTVSLQRLRITGGNAGSGGGIINLGKLTLTACTVAQNTSIGHGGGIFIGASGELTLIDSTVTENTATGNGGGIYQNGTGEITLDNSIVRQNTANAGGGILANSGVVNVIKGSTITENTASVFGGGIGVAPSGTVICDGSGGVTGNTASSGGGIFNLGGTVTLNSTPVSGNTPNNCAGSAVVGCIG